MKHTLHADVRAHSSLPSARTTVLVARQLALISIQLDQIMFGPQVMMVIVFMIMTLTMTMRKDDDIDIVSPNKVCSSDDLDKLTLWTRAFFEVKLTYDIRNN